MTKGQHAWFRLMESVRQGTATATGSPEGAERLFFVRVLVCVCVCVCLFVCVDEPFSYYGHVYHHCKRSSTNQYHKQSIV
jgi:hypothetical protein